jgi:hypothetical protein
MPTTTMPDDPAFEAARQQLHERLDAWTPPEGADETEVAELRARLDGLLDRYEPRPGQSVDDAIAELRDEFELRIDNFTQDQQIDALVEEVTDLQGGQGGAMTPDPEFEALRNQLRDSLANWQAPEGTSPEDAAELRAQLEALVDRYQPGAGRPADDALADLRAAFDERVQDFVQDQKIDALVEEQMEDDATGDADVDMPAGDMPAGDMPMATGTDTATDDLATDDMATDDMVTNDPLVKPVGDAPETSVLVDEFDSMIEPDGPMQGIAVGELDPTSRPHDLDMSDAAAGLEDDIFAVGDLDATTSMPAGNPAVTTTVEDLTVTDVPGLDDADGLTPELDERLTTSIDDLVPVGASDDDMFADDLETGDVDLDDQPGADDPFGAP